MIIDFLPGPNSTIHPARSLGLVPAIGMLLILLSHAAAAQPVALFQDLLPGPADEEDFPIGDVNIVGERVYFRVFDDPQHGTELWTSDLTPEGTSMVRDLCPGPWTGIPPDPYENNFLPAELDGAFVFPSYEKISLEESFCTQGLWITRGTAATTTLLKVGSIADVVALTDRVIFRAGPSSGVRHTLWVTDGTVAGTRELDVEINDSSYGLVRVGDRVFFWVHNDDGFELWKTDGTEAGTVRVAGPWNRDPLSVTVAGPRIFFWLGSELWRSDGTAQGTLMLHERPSFDFDDPYFSFPVVGEDIYFLNREIGSVLWVSDGTPEGTRPLGTVCAETSCTLSPWTENFAVAGERLFFLGQDEVHGKELWTSDGTAAGTFMLRDISPTYQKPERLTAVGETVFFTADDGETGRELWVSDGTSEGTVLIRDLTPAEGYGAPSSLSSGGDVLYFSRGPSGLWRSDGTAAGTVGFTGEEHEDARILDVVDGLLLFSASGALWSSDGTAAGTRALMGTGDARGASSSPMRFTTVGDRLFFRAAKETSEYPAGQLWQSDGTPDGTTPLFSTWLSPGYLASAGGKLFFTATGGLWVSDGTDTGTELLGSWSLSGGFDVLDDRLFGVYRERVYGVYRDRLWTSDGTFSGTFDLSPADGDELDDIYGLRTVGEQLFFLNAVKYYGHSELWRSDGTDEGTIRLTDDADTDISETESLGQPAVFAGAAYFVTHGSCDDELWRSDGTVEGTGLVVRFESDNCKYVLGIVSAEPGIFVLTYLGEQKLIELWLVDGTGDATRVSTLPAIPRLLEPGERRLFSAGERIFFALDDGVHGLELWSSDGETAGLVKDICPGGCTSIPYHLEAIDGRLFFAAADAVSGWEPWVSDGTEAGTMQIADIGPGAMSSTPREFFAFGDAIFFQADDYVHGNELWAVTSLPDCDLDPRTACLGADRFLVKVRWRNQHAGGTEGDGFAVPFSDETTLFWFFDESNLELAVKLLDGRAYNQHFWFFSGGLSDVEYWIDVTDTETDETMTYHNPPGEICGQADVRAFFGGEESNAVSLTAPLRWSPPAAGKAGGCLADDQTLCLLDGRFEVGVEWRSSTAEGPGRAQPASDESGYFWFFNPQNLELIVKVLDGRPINGRFWVFYGALSDVEYWITVTDTETGASRVYHSPPGEICGRGDVAAF